MTGRSQGRTTARVLTIGALLGLLLLRAYIPTGFMPAPGRPFQLELCQVGLHASLPANHDPHSGGSRTSDSCPFGNSPASAPLPAVWAFTPPAPIASPYAAPLPGPLESRALLAPRARAPPASA
jgi:hypothetical protein